MKILILKPSSLGDVVQALPVLRMIKKAHPEWSVYWWIGVESASLLENDSDLEGLVLFDRKGLSKIKKWPRLGRTIRQTRAMRFDVVLDLQALARSAVFGWLAGSRTLIGLEDRREGAPAFYHIAVPRPGGKTHAVDWYLESLKFLDTPIRWDFEWLPKRAAVQEQTFARWNARAPWFVIVPGARWANKRWPVAHFAELVRQSQITFPHHRFVILGGKEDAALGEIIAQARPGSCLNLAGKTTLPEMVEWIRESDLVITNDTGPMHVAAALRKPVVALFGPTSPLRTGPYGQLENALTHPLPCAPCLKSVCHYHLPIECLRATSPERVLAQMQRLETGRPCG